MCSILVSLVGFVWYDLVVGFDCFSDFSWCRFGLCYLVLGFRVGGFDVWVGLVAEWLYLAVVAVVVCYACVLIACVFIVAFIVILGFLWMGLCGVAQGLVFGDLLFAV